MSYLSHYLEAVDMANEDYSKDPIIQELLDIIQIMLESISDKEKEEHDDIGAQAHDPETCVICMARAAIEKYT